MQDKIALTREIESMKYLRPYLGATGYAISNSGKDHLGLCEAGLPIPPKRLWIGYGSTESEYLESGKRHVTRMLEVMKSSGFDPLFENSQILDFGCGAGRMMRHLIDSSGRWTIYGCDVSGDHILWGKEYLSPPLRFITNTTLPHLPFAEKRFNFIYCGSVFSHLDDLADSWLCELHRVLSPDGRLFVSIHDENTVDLLKGMKHKLGNQIADDPDYQKHGGKYKMLVIDRGTWAQTFYRTEYFAQQATLLGFDIESVTERAYGYQTGVVMKISQGTI